MRYEVNSYEFDLLEDREKRDFVIDWFHTFFRDPVHEMPFVDGEYRYPYGGPYCARDVLEEIFGSSLDESTVSDLIGELEEDGCFNWAPNSQHPERREVRDEYFQDHARWLSSHPLAIEADVALGEIEFLLRLNGASESDSLILRMLFIQCWSILESFLSNILLKHANEKTEIVGRLVIGIEKLRNQKLTLLDLVDKPNYLKSMVLAHIRRISFHDPKRMKTLIEIAFGKFKKYEIDVEAELEIFRKMEQLRHDCVHRNGKTTTSEPANLSYETVVDMHRATGKYITKVGSLVAKSFPATE